MAHLDHAAPLRESIVALRDGPDAIARLALRQLMVLLRPVVGERLRFAQLEDHELDAALTKAATRLFRHRRALEPGVSAEQLADASVTRVVLRQASAALRRGSDAVAWRVLDRLVARLAPIVTSRFQNRYRLSDEELEDSIAQALVRLFQYRRRVSLRGSLDGLFLAITHNEIRRLLRQRPRPLPDAIPAPTSEPPPDTSRLTAAIRSLLARLDRRDIAILEAFAASRGSDQWSLAVARDLGLTANAVRVRKHRALAQLRDSLRNLGFTTTDARKEP